MKPHWPVMVIFPALVWILSACSVSQVQDRAEPAEARPAEFEQLAELEREVHFLTPTEESVVVPPGAYMVEGTDAGLQLIPDDQQKPQPITIQAEATTHDESLDASRLISASIKADQHVIVLLFPDGQAMQAVGSYSGAQKQGFTFQKKFLKEIKPPLVNEILTIPKRGILQEDEIVIIKGKNFGAFKKGNGEGKVLIHGRFKRDGALMAFLRVQEWNPTMIKARVWAATLKEPFMDQAVKLQIKTAKGMPSVSWKMPLRSRRWSKWLDFKDQVVQVLDCSMGADGNICNGDKPTIEMLKEMKSAISGGPSVCKIVSNSPEHGRYGLAAIWGRHKNCDKSVDWDEGRDQYEIRLKNGWVFKNIQRKVKKSSSKEWIMMPEYETLKKEVIGTSIWKLNIKWKISPNDNIEYAYYVQIEGPRGIPWN